MTYSTAVALSGLLVIIGGYSWPLVKSIHLLFNGQWVEIGSMSCDRWWCLVVSPSPDKMMIVGGFIQNRCDKGSSYLKNEDGMC